MIRSDHYYFPCTGSVYLSSRLSPDLLSRLSLSDPDLLLSKQTLQPSEIKMLNQRQARMRLKSTEDRCQRRQEGEEKRGRILGKKGKSTAGTNLFRPDVFERLVRKALTAFTDAQENKDLND